MNRMKTDGEKKGTYVRRPPIWRWKRVPSRPNRRTNESALVEDLSVPFPGYRPLRAPLLCWISYEGGPEAEVCIEARGWQFRFPGHVCVIDVVTALNGQLAVLDERDMTLPPPTGGPGA